MNKYMRLTSITVSCQNRFKVFDTLNEQLLMLRFPKRSNVISRDTQQAQVEFCMHLALYDMHHEYDG